ncbi:hypothetical protein D1872_287490 [compost metagenome]
MSPCGNGSVNSGYCAVIPPLLVICMVKVSVSPTEASVVLTFLTNSSSGNTTGIVTVLVFNVPDTTLPPGNVNE